MASVSSRVRPVTIRTDDDWPLRGSYWDARDDGAIALVLLHDRSANRSVWAPYVGFFLSRGWSVLTFDLRGHGESVKHAGRGALHARGEDVALEAGWPLDLRAALAFTGRQPKTDPAKRAVVGVGLGADLAYAASARDWGAKSVVGVSPDDVRARVLAGGGAFVPRGASLLFAGGDANGSAAALGFAAAAESPAECHAYADSSAVAMDLWQERQPEIVARSIAWIERVC